MPFSARITVGTALTALLFSQEADAFTNGLSDFMPRAFVPKQELKPYSEAFFSKVLDVRLDIGAGKRVSQQDANNRMSIQNLQVSLEQDTSEHAIPMPGFNGPHPKTSSGVRQVDLQKSGQFISLSGLVHPNFETESAAWEIVWREDAPSGALIVGLNLQEDVKRNSAKLSKGQLYMSFPIWTAARLAEFQDRKTHCDKRAAAILKERDDELAKMQETNNFIAKAFHYRNAAAAVEQYSLQPIRTMALVPKKGDVIEVTGDVFLTKVGTLWTKGGGAFLGSSQQQVVLGTATLKEIPQEEPEKPTSKKRVHLAP